MALYQVIEQHCEVGKLSMRKFLPLAETQQAVSREYEIGSSCRAGIGRTIACIDNAVAALPVLLYQTALAVSRGPLTLRMRVFV